MESFDVWQSRPVFVTSTFRDFQAERDHLHSHVFPELEERLKARFHHLEPIDLRWGVDNASLAEEEARQRLVLKVCLAEILRSRPFLIGLIGDRYGWVPPLERMQAAAHEAGHQGKLEGKSVTALEIEYGVLDNPDQCARSRFYFRKPLPYDAMDPRDAAVYSERHSGEPDAAAAQANLDALKARIRLELPGRWRSYRAQWDGKQRRVVGLDDWGRQVLEDLWADLETETAAWAGAASATWQRQEAWLIEQFVETKRRDFVGRESVLAALEAHALSPAAEGAAWGLCLTGPAGGGKSAVFAELCRRLAGRDLLLLAQAAGIGIRSGQVQPLLRRWIGELAQALGLPDPAESLTKQEELEQTFASLLGRAAQTRRVVCLLDALNQFEPTPVTQHLTWLPKPWPANARLIATAIPGTQSEALVQRPGTVTRALPPLDPAEAGAVADALCRRYRKLLPEPVRAALAAKRRPDGQLAAGTPLWLSLAVEELLLLDADDFARARTMPGATAGERMRALLVDVAQSLPPEVETLYAYLLDRAEEIHGRDWTRAFVEATALSRHGWRESDLEALVPKLSGQTWTDLAFAALRRTFRAHLVQRGAQGQWDFAHAQLREAVRRRNLADAGRCKALHGALAEHLAQVDADDPVRATERMYHLIQADDRPRVAIYYAGLEDGSAELAGATATLAEHLLAGEGEVQNPHLAWALGLLGLPGQTPATTGGLCQQYLFPLGDALEPGARLALRYSLFEGARGKLERLAGADPGNAGWLRDLALCSNKIGHLLEASADVDGAERCYRVGLEIQTRLAAAGKGNATDLATSQVSIGDVLNARGDLAGAERAYRAALELQMRTGTADPGTTETAYSIALSLDRIGNVSTAMGDLAEGERAYLAARDFVELLVAAEPDNAAWEKSLSVSHEKIGNILTERGKTAESEQAYCAAEKLLTRLATANPSDFTVQRDLAILYGKIGDSLSGHGDIVGAERAYRAGMEITSRLSAADSSNAVWQRDLAVTYSKIGDILIAGADVAAAERAYEAALKLHTRLAAADPVNSGWQRDVAVSHIKIGDVLTARGDLAAASGAYQAALEVTSRLAATDPSNTGWQRDLAISHRMIGDALMARGQLAAAERAYRAAQEIHTQLATAFPENASWQHDLAVSHRKVGEALSGQANLHGAERAHRAALEIRTRLAAIDPGNANWQYELSLSHDRIGNVLSAQGNLAEAELSYRAALEIAQRLPAEDRSNIGWQRDLAVSHSKIGDLRAAQGDLAEAERAYRAGMELHTRLAATDPNNVGWQRDLSVSQTKLAMLLDRSGSSEAVEHWVRAYESLAAMEVRSVFLSSEDQQVLGALRQKVEAGVIGTTLLGHRALAADPWRGTAAASAPAGPTSAAPQGQPVDLGEIRSLLDAGRSAEALQRIQAADDDPPEVRNAHAVCLMRLGNLEGAVKLLRGLVLPNDVMSIDRDIPDKYKLNFATALLLEGNFDGCRNALAALQDPKHPTAARLREADARWRKSLSLGQKLGLWMGSMPDVPIELGAPPGEA